MSTAQNIIDSARALLGVGSSASAGSDAEMLVWLNLDYARLRARVAQIAPDRYTAVVAFDVASGANTYTIVSTDFEAPRKVGRRGGVGLAYRPLPVLPYATAENACSLGWRRRGSVLEFFPIISAPNTAGVDSYQMSYLTKAATLAAGDTIDLPVGMERSLEWGLVARGRARLGDGGERAALDIASDFEREDLLALANQHPGSPDTSGDVTGMY